MPSPMSYSWTEYENTAHQPLSNFLEIAPEIKELDLNPVFAYNKGVLDVDARVVLEAE